MSFLSLTIQASGESTAQDLLQESLRITQDIGYRWGVGNALDGLGLLTQVSDPQEARKLFKASSDVYKEIGDLRSLARAFSHQGFNSLLLGDLDDARRMFRESLLLSRKCNYMPYALDALTGFASMYGKQIDPERALELVWIVLNHAEISQITRARAAHLQVELEAQLMPSQIDAIHIRARTLRLDNILDSLLK
jgi:tetratricopeptide (TPR) repeat protein